MKKPAARSPDQERLFELSGSVVLTGKLEAFLYLLMRDHVPPGVIGDLLKELSAAGAGECSYTNGWLARYAEHVAGELRGGEELTSEGAATLAAVLKRPGKRIPKLAAVLKPGCPNCKNAGCSRCSAVPPEAPKRGRTSVRRWSDDEAAKLVEQAEKRPEKGKR